MSQHIKVGTTFEKNFSFSQESVNAFAQITGDQNPLHLDQDYAATTPFKRPIMHGMLSASIFSRLLGMEFPGPGTVYLKQEMEFLRPMFVNTEYIAILEVKNIQEKRHQATISTVVKDLATDKMTIRGTATVMHSELIG